MIRIRGEVGEDGGEEEDTGGRVAGRRGQIPATNLFDLVSLVRQQSVAAGPGRGVTAVPVCRLRKGGDLYQFTS